MDQNQKSHFEATKTTRTIAAIAFKLHTYVDDVLEDPDQHEPKTAKRQAWPPPTQTKLHHQQSKLPQQQKTPVEARSKPLMLTTSIYIATPECV
ncbi:UNVERIFIED_CONTAM: hypothetical protein FKN15_057598 [Acipenser sinensis]